MGDACPLDSKAIGEGADNVRIDAAGHRVLVGYTGALALIDAATGEKTAEIPLKGHPGSFQLEPNGPRVFVNVPDAHEIAVVDRVAAQQTASFVPELDRLFPAIRAGDGTGAALWVFQPSSTS